MTKPTVYIETTIPSYLTAWRSPSLVMAAQQETTRQWWDVARINYELFISEFVFSEAAAGDKKASERRIAVIEHLPELTISIEVEQLAAKLLTHAALPRKAKMDALHIAIAAIHGMDYLLTWNCKHIANAIMRPKIEQLCRLSGYEPPVICTPLELIEV